jgi:hypothetical protein
MVSGSVILNQEENDCSKVLVLILFVASWSATLVFTLFFCIGFELQGNLRSSNICLLLNYNVCD